MDVIVRYAWEDQFPSGFTESQLRNAARDSVIRYARHFGLTFRWSHDSFGERWKKVDTDAQPWPEMWPYGQVPTGIHGWRSVAEII